MMNVGLMQRYEREIINNVLHMCLNWTYAYNDNDMILKAIMERYGGFETLYDAIDEGGMETVLVNLSDDLNYKYTYKEIIELIERL